MEKMTIEITSHKGIAGGNVFIRSVTADAVDVETDLGETTTVTCQGDDGCLYLISFGPELAAKIKEASRSWQRAEREALEMVKVNGWELAAIAEAEEE